MQLSTYLSFNGNCREAFEFYANVFDTPIGAMISHGDTPAKDHVPAEAHDSIIHAHIKIGKSLLMGADTPPNMEQSAQQGFSITVLVETVDEAKRLFGALSEDGKIIMPMEETFFSKQFGMCTDRFGTPWMINCDPEMAAK